MVKGFHQLVRIGALFLAASGLGCDFAELGDGDALYPSARWLSPEQLVTAVSGTPDDLALEVATGIEPLSRHAIQTDKYVVKNPPSEGSIAMKADYRNLPFRDGAFGKVVGKNIPLPDPEVLPELFRVLRSGGEFYFVWNSFELGDGMAESNVYTQNKNGELIVGGTQILPVREAFAYQIQHRSSWAREAGFRVKEVLLSDGFFGIRFVKP